MQDASPEVRQEPTSVSAQDGHGHPYNEHVLRLMHSLNIDENKTVDVCIDSTSPPGCVATTVGFWLANFPCPALDLQQTGDHLRG